MEAQLIRCLKKLISEIFMGKTVRPDEVIDDFLEKSELTISPSSKEELVKHLQDCIVWICLKWSK
jgi:hypothetical protein